MDMNSTFFDDGNSTISYGDMGDGDDDNNRPGQGYGNGNGFWRGGGGRFTNDDLGPTTRISVWILAGLSLAFVIVRLYCKFVRHRRFHADDYFCTAAWVSLQTPIAEVGMATDNPTGSITRGYDMHKHVHRPWIWQTCMANTTGQP